LVVGQGTIAIAPRDAGASDLGIAMMRKRFFDELDAVAKGAEPKATLRNANIASSIELPTSPRRPASKAHARGARGLSAAEGAPEGFRHCAGQPAEVRGR